MAGAYDTPPRHSGHHESDDDVVDDVHDDDVHAHAYAHDQTMSCSLQEQQQVLTVNVNEKSSLYSPPPLTHHLDYKSKADIRRMELETLRQKQLAKPKRHGNCNVITHIPDASVLAIACHITPR